ncbi:hypothetical protein B566_EDAN005914 [Ephemera danica]|nr:hypothetical protein B566_EDAN005914 [Ephemera danica]
MACFYLLKRTSWAELTRAPRTTQPVAVHCEPLEVDDPHVTAHVEGSRLGHTAIFQCPVGYRINGTANITCHASGQWSGPAPRCMPVTCPSLHDEAASDPRLQLLEQNTSYGGRVIFRCTWGYRLTGPPKLLCERDGRWSGPVPSCSPVLCPPLQPPLHGHILDTGGRPTPNGRYTVGSAVQFGCSEAHQLLGEPTIVCSETGDWSHAPPFCKAQCPYPGDPEHGRIAPVKFYYEPGDHVKVTCLAGFVARETARPTCQPNGTWSEPVPQCISYSEV